jgi:hypothetical protein
MAKFVLFYAKAFRAEGLVLALFCLLTAASCDFPQRVGDGNGSLTIVLPGAGAPARAVHLPEPVTGNMSYTLGFYPSGESVPAHAIGPTQDKVVTVELAPGHWDIEVTAYYGTAINDAAKTALVRKTEVEILAGQANSVSFEMSADDFITPGRAEETDQDTTVTTSDTPPDLSVTMHTSTAFSGIDGWADDFSYQWYWEDDEDADKTRHDISGADGSFSASDPGSETLICTVDNNTEGTFWYWVEISNAYTYTPPEGGAPTSGSMTKSIRVANVVVNPAIVIPTQVVINITWPAGHLPQPIIDNMRYAIEFIKVGGSSVRTDPTQEKTITRELEPGDYYIVAEAHYGDSTEWAGVGKKPEAVEVPAEETTTVPIEIHANDFLTPYIDGDPINKTMNLSDPLETLSITMKTSTAFSGIPGWHDSFSYQVYYRKEGSETRVLVVGGSGSFAPGSATLDWPVNPSTLGPGTFYYDAEITNIYTYDPTSTSATVKNTIGLGRVVVNPPPPSYSVGDLGPAGGTVFYYDSAGFTSNGVLCYYLEVGPVDLGDGMTDYEWGANGTFLGVTGSGIGDGYTNTQTIVTQLGLLGESDRLAQIADAYSVGGYSDWFLASQDELYELYHSGLTSFLLTIPHSMWSSTEFDASSVWTVWGAGTINDPKNSPVEFRPIRAF